MATAILRYTTASGLVLGADGKVWDIDKQVALSMTAQKIFQIPHAPAAYAMYGEIGVGDDDPDSAILLDLSVEIKRITESQAKTISDLQSFGTILGNELRELLLQAKAKGAVFKGNQESPIPISTIARILLFGYFDGMPSEVNILLAHREQILPPAQVFPVDLRRSNPEVFGSSVIAQRVFVQPEPENITLSQAANQIERYIRICDSKEGRAADAFCNFIGGHIHIAALTADGFRWLRPPI